MSGEGSGSSGQDTKLGRAVDLSSSKSPHNLGEPLGIFVYGTLMRGFKNFHMAQRAGWWHSSPAHVEGYDLFLLPFGYPAVVEGSGQVFGELQLYRDMNDALSVLDPFENVGRQYERITATVWTREGPRAVWMYRYLNPDQLTRVGGVLEPSGRYKE